MANPHDGEVPLFTLPHPVLLRRPALFPNNAQALPHPVLLLLLFILPLSGRGEEISPSLEIQKGGVVYTRLDQDLRKDFAGEDKSEVHSKLLGNLEIRHPGRYRIYGSFLLSHEFLWNGKELRARATPELWEAWGRWETELYTLEAGNIIRRWGRGVPSLWDILNPPDLSEGFIREDEYQKLPIPMIRGTWYREDEELELLYSPFYRPPRTPPPQSDWGVLRISDFEGLETYPLVQAALSQGVYPGITRYPRDDFLHGELGLRYSRTLTNWDLDLYWFWGYDRIPLPEFHPDFLNYLNRQTTPLPQLLRNLSLQELVLFNPLYEIRPRRVLFLGGGASTQSPLGSLRLELEGINQEPIYEEGLNLLRIPALHALLGLDSLSREEFLYSFSLIGVSLFTRKELFLIHPLTLLASGLARGKIAPRLKWEVRGLLNLTLGDSWLSPSLLYELIPDLTLQAGTHLFLSPEDLPLGFFNHNNLLFFRLKWLF